MAAATKITFIKTILLDSIQDLAKNVSSRPGFVVARLQNISFRPLVPGFQEQKGNWVFELQGQRMRRRLSESITVVAAQNQPASARPRGIVPASHDACMCRTPEFADRPLQHRDRFTIAPDFRA